MKRLLLLMMILLALPNLKGQVAVSYYPFQSLLSVSTNTEKLFWLDYRVETNTFFTNLNMELSPMWNIRSAEIANYYIGPGISFNPAYSYDAGSFVNGYFLDIGVRVKPLKSNRDLQVVFELSPYFNKEGNGGNLRSRLGISYNFSFIGKK